MYNLCGDIILFFLYAKLNIQEAEAVVFADDTSTNMLVIDKKEYKTKLKILWRSCSHDFIQSFDKYTKNSGSCFSYQTKEIC
jgi:hypothetical protein